jgi:hypothetical protein
MSEQYGDIQFEGKDIVLPPMKFDRLALSGRGELLLLSLVADARLVKASRAILNGGAKATIIASGVTVNQPGRDDWYARSPGRLVPTSEGYQTHTHKLGYGLVYALFLTRMPGFMKVVSREALWQELNAVRFTTPLLREWLPHVETRLRCDGHLDDAHAFNCQCAHLSATSATLDTIVSDGLKNGDLVIPSVARCA